MRALFVSSIFPTDRTAVTGVFNRMGLFIEAAKSLADELDLLLFAPPEINAQAKDRGQIAEALWGRPGVNIFIADRALPGPRPTFFRAYLSGSIDFLRLSQAFHSFHLTTGSEQIAAFERCLDRCPDWIFVHRLEAMGPLLLTKRALPPIFFDLDDLEHRAFLTGLRIQKFWPGKTLCYLHPFSIMLGERRSVRLAQATFVCSPQDRDSLRRLSSTDRVFVIPNSIAIPKDPVTVCDQRTLAFIGSFTYAPNRDAADFLIDNIWPLIKREVADANLLIVGSKPERLDNYRRECPGVTFTGFVDDIEQLYGRIRVIACPIRAGGGTRVKIIEAAAHGKAVVSSKFGASGLEFSDGEDILLRDGISPFVAACVALLKDTEECRRLGQAAHEKAKRLYNRSHVLSLTQQLIASKLTDLIGKSAEVATPRSFENAAPQGRL